MSIGKKIGIAIGVLVFVLCLVVCCWYLYILEYGAEKMTSTTVNIGTLQVADGSQDNRYVIEVDYKSNANHNGLELFDVNVSYFTDETREHYYSQGIQYVANSTDESIEWVDFDTYYNSLINGVSDVLDNNFTLEELQQYMEEHYALTSYTLHSSGWWIFANDYIASYYDPFVDPSSASRYTYQSLDDFASTDSTNPITEDSYFLLQIGDDEYVYMQFKGDNYVKWEDFENADDFNGDSRKVGSSGDINYYYNNSIDYLAYLLYQSVQRLPAGTNGAYTFEFADDMFTYYAVNVDGSVGEEIVAEDTDLVINRIKSYYTIYITTSADGARNSNDSMFGLLHGSPSCSLDGSSSSAGEYFQGKPVINCDVYDFDLVLLTDNYYALKLKQEFIDEYLPYANSIYLSVTIDTSIIEDAGYKYSGLLPDSGLNLFDVLKITEVSWC